MRPPQTKRIPLTELPSLAPPSAEAQALLPDGGRGSPVKGACMNAYPPPPTFSALDIQHHISLMQRTQPRGQIVTPKSSPITDVPSSPPQMSDADILAMSETDLPIDDGAKPPHSYATLIGMAILRAPERKLTLSAIYAWISSSFRYYSATESGWQNSIRHNLSLNKAFVKVERPKDEPGKGHYWTVDHGCESQFLKGKASKKSSSSLVRASGSTVKRDSKKRQVEFDEVPRMKRITLSPPSSAHESRTPVTIAPASPPPTDKRKRDTTWDYNDSGYFSSANDDSYEVETQPYKEGLSRSELYSREFSYSANALDLVLSPPPSSSPVRQSRVGLLIPKTPAIPCKKTTAPSPGTSLREHREHMVQMLASPDLDVVPYDAEDDPWVINTPKVLERNNRSGESPWDEVAERAAFGSPDKRESRRRDFRRSLVCGLHAQELYETGFESSYMPGVNVLDIMKREVERAKTGGATSLRPSIMERSQSSMF